MNKKIAILAGDGIGPEVMTQAIRVLDAIATKFGHKFEYTESLVGGAAYDKHQNHLPQETIDVCNNSDAVLFGSVGGPVDKQHEAKWANCEAKSILALRKAFNFNINLRKMALYTEIASLSPLKPELLSNGLDIVIFRELLGDVYFGEHTQTEKNGERYAFDSGSYTESQIKSIAEYAFKVAKTRSKRLISVDKANVMAMSKLWRQVVSEVAKDNSDIEYSDMLVDNCAMQIIKNPSQFDVILTSNLFGDILSDELSVLSGSVGMMPSASFSSSGLALYEPAGGSAPDIAGKNIANPIAQILSASLMLGYSFNMLDEAKIIDEAVKATIVAGYRTGDIYTKGANEKMVGTKEFTDQVIAFISK
ncbi:MAG: 3-isopropylmalate dehydrogenase [Burkholderiales bacterium]|nr:3-isopropylmalate dehydrogenase [Burkholderiales bacterium]